jgi:hypothetical protein
MSNVYTINGYKNRREYLESLAREYGVSYMEVYGLASLLGENEDFDGLISALEDMEVYEEMYM